MQDMYSQDCNMAKEHGQFFDITHTFKIGSMTYHILGLRKDRPSYKNTYYIFNCADDLHNSTKRSISKPALSKRIPSIKHRPHTDHRLTRSSTNSVFSSSTEIILPKRTSTRAYTRSLSSKQLDNDTSTMEEKLTKAIKSERQLAVATLRHEMLVKKNGLIRTMKKHKEKILEYSKEMNKQDDIIRLLEEQRSSLLASYEKCNDAIISSIDSLRNTLSEIANVQKNTNQTIGNTQQTLIQIFEKEINKILLKNDEIRQSTSMEIKSIERLQNVLIEKLENYATIKKANDDATLSRLFKEQKQALTDVLLTQRQDTLSLDMIKQTMVNVLNEQQINSNSKVDNEENTEKNNGDISSKRKSVKGNIFHSSKMNLHPNSRTINQLSSSVALKKTIDQNLFKIAIESKESARIYAKLSIDGIEYPRRLHTLCQRDIVQNDMINCYIAPPNQEGPYDVNIYAKTDGETTYRSAFSVRLPTINISQPITFPLLHQSFEEHRCILVEPFQRSLLQNQQVPIHIIVPNAYGIRIRNGDETIDLDKNEYKKHVAKKTIRVRGDVHIMGCWDEKTYSVICAFSMIRNTI